MTTVSLHILQAFWAVLTDMAPYLLFGFFIAGVLSVLIPPEKVEQHLGGRGLLSVLKAALFGIPLPLCSCSVIPVSASLRRHGAHRGAATSFLISAPQTGIDSILVTYSLLGPVFALFRPLAALVSGIVGGALVTLTDTSTGNTSGEGPSCEEECCAGGGGRPKFSRAIKFGFVTLPRDVGKPLLLGILVAGAIAALVPDDYFAGILGSGIGAMVVMLFLGIPVYVCATASVPVAAALIAKGVTPGAALVFLMTGAATNAATITTAWKMLGKRSAILYLGSVMLTALISGLVLDYLVISLHSGTSISPSGWMLPPMAKNISALLLLILLLTTSTRRRIT